MLTHSDRVLVTGGTGFTGSALVKKLAARGCKVRVLARSSSNRAALDGIDVEWVIGDVFDPEAVAAAVDGVGYIFHLAAAYREAKLGDSAYSRVHITSTELLARSAQRNPDFKRFVHVSTVGVLGHIERPPADETAPFNPADVYQRTKMQAELLLRDFCAETKLPFVVVRPAAIYGPGDRRLLKLFRFAKLPFVPLLGSTRGLYHLVHVEDLVEFLMLAGVHPAAQGEVFICGNPTATSIREIVSTVAEHLGRTARFVRLPAWPFVAAGAVCETVCPPLGIEPPIYRRRIAFFTKDRAFDTSKMANTTGFRCRYSNAEGIAATADWYLKEGWL